MRKTFAVLFVLLAWWGTQCAETPLPPPPQRWVTDAQSHLSASARENLDRRLEAYEHTTGHQVLVWIGESTGNTPLEDWTVRTFASWKVGRKGLDDGLVLFILAQDRKLRIEVGYGLEGQMPDAIASRIIRETVTKLSSWDWDAATSAGVDGILKTLGGEDPASAQQHPSPEQRVTHPLGIGQIIILVLLGLGFLILLITHPGIATWLLFSMLSGRRGGGGSGWSGGGGGGWSGGGGSSGGGGASGSW